MINFLLTFVAGLWRVFVTMVLWNWFIASPFNLPVLNFGMAYVMLMVAMLFTAQLPLTFTKPTFEDIVVRVTTSYVWPAMCLLIGWIILLLQ